MLWSKIILWCKNKLWSLWLFNHKRSLILSRRCFDYVNSSLLARFALTYDFILIVSIQYDLLSNIYTSLSLHVALYFIVIFTCPGTRLWLFFWLKLRFIGCVSQQLIFLIVLFFTMILGFHKFFLFFLLQFYLFELFFFEEVELDLAVDSLAVLDQYEAEVYQNADGY